MSKFTEFYDALQKHEDALRKFSEMIGDRKIEEADDETFLQIGKLAEELGYEITLEDAHNYFRNSETELDEDDLEAVAGGKTGDVYTHYIVCQIGGSAKAEK